MLNMEVRVAKSAGFCFGVKRAVNLVYECAESTSDPIFTYGPIIHNEEVTKDLQDKGVEIIENLEDLKVKKTGKIILRSHGVSKKVIEDLDAISFAHVDATCPFVKKIHDHVANYSKEGYAIVIIGNANHPEVEGIKGWSETEDTYIIDSAEEAEQFSVGKDKKICIVAQTTYNGKKFEELVEIICKKGYDNTNVINTICNATSTRQTEAAQLAKECEAMIVIGSKTSSNTQKLFEICKKECANTYYIQTIHDLNLDELKKYQIVGITAGASTPNYIIEEVQKNVRNEF